MLWFIFSLANLIRRKKKIKMMFVEILITMIILFCYLISNLIFEFDNQSIEIVKIAESIKGDIPLKSILILSTSDSLYSYGDLNKEFIFFWIKPDMAIRMLHGSGDGIFKIIMSVLNIKRK